MPGFSTADTVTEVSGRGVGMDVVKRNVEALGGSITIQSEAGQGTCFRIKLPLTLAILDGQVRAGRRAVYILPLAVIVESVRPVAPPVASRAGHGERFTVRGRGAAAGPAAPAVPRRAAATDPTEALVVIVEHDGAARPPSWSTSCSASSRWSSRASRPTSRRSTGSAGATILGDGRVALILDVPGLVTLARMGNGVAPAMLAEAVAG